MNLFILSIAHNRLGNKCVCDSFMIMQPRHHTEIQDMIPVNTIDFMKSSRAGLGTIVTAGWTPNTERTDSLRQLCVVNTPFEMVAWNDPEQWHAARLIFWTGIRRGSPGSFTAVSEKTLHGVNNRVRGKVRMVQKILNKIVGAKYITILRTW